MFRTRRIMVIVRGEFTDCGNNTGLRLRLRLLAAFPSQSARPMVSALPIRKSKGQGERFAQLSDNPQKDFTSREKRSPVITHDSKPTSRDSTQNKNFDSVCLFRDNRKSRRANERGLPTLKIRSVDHFRDGGDLPKWRVK